MNLGEARSSLLYSVASQPELLRYLPQAIRSARA